MIRKTLWIFILITLAQFSSYIHIENTIGAGLYYSSEFVDSTQIEKPIAIVGDLQRTSFLETIIFREQNDLERFKIIDAISKEDISSVVFLGDMIFDGSSESDWYEFDKLISPLKNNNIPLYPVLGNHEYWGPNSAALDNCKKRFTAIKEKHWYSKKQGNLGLIFLDSNEDDMTEEKWIEQKKWYEETIALFEQDPSIDYFCVFTHHPPYTNSTVTGDETHVQEAFTEIFDSSTKGEIFFSGHAHTYERFEKNNKTYIVSGGGGGPRVSLTIGPDCHIDSFSGTAPRPFHYILLSQDKNGLSLTVKGLKKGTSEFFVMENLTYPPLDYAYQQIN